MKTGYKKFLLLWAGELISAIGSGLTSFGLGVYVFQLTGSAAYMAIITLLGFLPSILLSIPAGVLADKLDRRLLMILGDGLSGLGIVFILVMMLLNRCEIWHIYVGVTISSVFSSLLAPAFNATITDLVGKEDFTKASGMMSMAGSSKFLISPLLAGLLLGAFDIKLLLIIDIATFIVTVCVTMIVRKGIKASEKEEKVSTKEFIKEGFDVLKEHKGIIVLIVVASIINLFMGFIQVLSESLVLGFTDSTTLGIVESICASGMLISSIVIGIIGIKKHQVAILGISLIFAGLAMVGFGLFENIYIIGVFGFLFFLSLPLANTCLDFLVRKNVEKDKQGRVWGIIGFISNLGSVVSFATCGFIADGVKNGFDITISRASGYVITAGGALLALASVSVFFFKSLYKLERDAINNASLENIEQ